MTRTFLISLAIAFVLPAASNAQKLPQSRVSHSRPAKVASSTSPKLGDVRKTALGMDLVWVPPGEFMMGSSDAQVDAAWTECKKYYAQCSRHGFAAEQPRHLVTIKNGFWMGKFEVTRAQWRAVMSDDPSTQKDCGEDCPVDSVSWEDVQKFIASLNEKHDGLIYSLPTETEWEYAARAGTKTAYAFGDSLTLSQANFNTEHPYKFTKGAVKVGSYKPNAWGLYDMHGNVWEWVQDMYNENYGGSLTDGSATIYGYSNRRVIRGGSWQGDLNDARSANRLWNLTNLSDYGLGFRVVARAEPLTKKIAGSQTPEGFTVAQIVAPFLLPAGSPKNTTVWSSLDNLGVVWPENGKVYEVTGFGKTYGNFHRVVSIPLAGRGNADVRFSGSKTVVEGAVISLYRKSLGPAKLFGADEFATVLREQFGPEATIKLVRGKCQDIYSDFPSSGYMVVLKGKKPIYVLLKSYIPPNDPSSGYSTFSISLRKTENWKCGFIG